MITLASVFEGEFRDGEKIKGTEQTNEGVYQGFYKNSLRDGTGTFKRNDG